MLSKNKIDFLLREYREKLLNEKKNSFSLSKDWPNQFPNQAGLYAIWDKDQLVYIGETGNIRKRMRDLRRTVNHSFRRSLGYSLFHYKATSREKFKPEHEEALDDYCLNNISIAHMALAFGRLEVEEYLVEKYRDQLLNKKLKRM